MAKATKHSVENYTVTLELDEEEAKALRRILGARNPVNEDYRPGHRIWEALRSAGVPGVYGL